MPPYKRPFVELKDQHDLVKEFSFYKQIKPDQSGWLQKELGELNQSGLIALRQFRRAIDQAKGLQLSELKDEIAKARRAEPLVKAREAAYSFLKRGLDIAAERVEKSRNMILRVTAPEDHADPTKALLAELRLQEIRNLIRAADQKDRRALISDKLDFIRAAIGSPLPLIDPDALEQIRYQFAFAQDPSMADMLRDDQVVYNETRQRASEIAGTLAALAVENGLDLPDDPILQAATFPARDDQEAALQARRIREHQRKLDRQERQAAWDAKQKQGVELGGQTSESRLRQLHEAGQTT